jgi:hypothetical protein
MGVLGGAWLATGTLTLTSAMGSTNRTLGLFLFFEAAALLIPTSVATLGKVAAAIVTFRAGGPFALTRVYQFTRTTGWERTSDGGDWACAWLPSTRPWHSRAKTPAGTPCFQWAVEARDGGL